MTAALVAGLLAGYAVAVPVGPVAAYLVALCGRAPLYVGVAAALGVATADGLLGLVGVMGGAALVGVLEPALGSMRMIAGIVLLVLAVRVGWGAARTCRIGRPAPVIAGTDAVRVFAGLLAVTMVNPSTVLYFVAIVAGGNAELDAAPTCKVVFAVAVFSASASWQLFLAGCGAVLGRALTGSRGQLATAVVSSVAMGVAAVPLVCSG